MRKQEVLLLTAMVWATPVNAVESTNWFQTVRKWDYFISAGLGWGQHNLYEADNSSSDVTQSFSGYSARTIEQFSGDFDDDDKSWRVSGGAWFHEHFGVEFGYVDLGKTTLHQNFQGSRETILDFSSPAVFLAPPPGIISVETDFTSVVEITGVSLLSKARIPFTRFLELEASLGAIRWNVNERRNITDSFTASGPISIFFPSPTQTVSSETLKSDDFDLAYGLAAKARVSEKIRVSFEWMRYETTEFDTQVDFVGLGIQYHFDFSKEAIGVLEKYTNNPQSLLGALQKLWPFERTAQRVPPWEYFAGLGSGLGEHNYLGDPDSEDVVTEMMGATTTSEIFSIDEDAAVWRTYVGAYVHRFFGFELGYMDFGRVESSFSTSSLTVFPAFVVGGIPLLPQTSVRSTTSIRSSAEISAYTLKVLARYPFLSRFEFGANLGASIWDVDAKSLVETSGAASVITTGGRSSELFIEDGDSGVDVNYGVSIKAKLCHNLWGGFEYARYEVGEFDEDIDYLGLTLQYRFDKK